MSIVTSSVQAGSVLAGLIIRPETASPVSGQTVTDRFTAALRSALSEAGLQAGEIQIEAGNGDAQPVDREGGTLTLTVKNLPLPHNSSSATPLSMVFGGKTEGVAVAAEQAEAPGFSEDDLLNGDLTLDMLRSVDDPLALIHQRLEQLLKPTDASVRNDRTAALSPLNPGTLSTREQAEGMRDRLVALGLDVGQVQEQGSFGGPYHINWGSEPRRLYQIDGMNVGGLLSHYARYTKEFADRQVMDEFRLLSA